MKSKIKSLFLSFTTALFLTLTFFCTSALAQINCNDPNLPAEQAIQCGTNAAAGSNQPASRATRDLNNLVANIINVLSIAVGIIAVVMIILGGFRYVTSGGDATKVQSAKNSLMYAIIGLIVVALAQIIVRFVLKKTI
ncbi:hypothetical protein A3E49_01355 [Candidatus Saccharibacteria bacterium RIFCSPHIGHO2_12_FULL_49_19]|nr:MAG: hypothetical protein A3E49_01355 [Candidatus Saccharibacteria bacterium RIFCSPHIGHO2_12_FULL_49_19]